MKKIFHDIREMHLGSDRKKLSWIRSISSVVVLVILINYSGRVLFNDGFDLGIHEFLTIAGCLGFKAAQRYGEGPKKEEEKPDPPDHV